jgi:hypothetical protein
MEAQSLYQESIIREEFLINFIQLERPMAEERLPMHQVNPD